MISISEAQRLIKTNTGRLEPVTVPIDESLGMVLARDIVSRDEMPPFDNSAMDGYAARADDLAGVSPDNPVRLDIIDDIRAGDVSDADIGPGQAARIMTGAQIPRGADCVVKVEDTVTEDGEVRTSFDHSDSSLHPAIVVRGCRSGGNIRRAGEDISAGQTALEKGRELGPAEIGLLAALGYTQVEVFRRPKVAVITTGDELLGAGQALVPGKIRNSNTYALFAQIRQAGGEPVRMGVAADTMEALRDLLEEAKASCDVLITTGGVSVGRYDLVKDVLDELGAVKIFWGVAQKPGKPMGFWSVDGALVFGLPGNPVAVMVCFEEYVRPALRAMMGFSKIYRPVVQGVLAGPVRKRKGRDLIMRVIVNREDGQYTVGSTGPQGSGILSSMTAASGLSIVPDDRDLMEPGEKVETHLITLPEDH